MVRERAGECNFFAALLLDDVDKVQIGRDLELIFLERSRHGLPISSRMNDLPVIFFAETHRHLESWFIHLPPIRYSAVAWVELQLQSRNRRMPQVLVENRSQIHSGVRVEIRDHVLGHDVLILEMLVEVVEKLPPPVVVVDDAAEGVDK